MSCGQEYVNIETNYYSHYVVNDFMKWIYKKLKSSDQIQSVVGIFLVIQAMLW